MKISRIIIVNIHNTPIRYKPRTVANDPDLIPRYTSLLAWWILQPLGWRTFFILSSLPLFITPLLSFIFILPTRYTTNQSSLFRSRDWLSTNQFSPPHSL